MKQLHRSIRLVVTFVATVATMGTLFGVHTASAADTAAGMYVLASGNQIARVIDGNGSVLSPSLTVSGLATGEQLTAIAVRPLNNRLYGLASNGAGAVRLYHIDSGSGTPVATALSAAPVQFDDGTAPVAIAGTAFDISFNPTVDRVRVISNTGVNFRMNPNNGAIVDANTTTPGVNPDGPLNGGSTTAAATAYTNSFVNATATTQYTLDNTTGNLFIQNPPNNGTLISGARVSVSGTPVTFTDAALDIPSSVTVAAANTPATGMAYAVLEIDNNDSLYMLDLSNGAATLVGNLGDLAVLDIALPPMIPVGIAASNDGLTLQRFRLDQPGTVAVATVMGLPANEVLVGMDGRPATGQLVGLGVNAAANTATLYVVDPQNGMLTAIGTPGAITFVDANGAAVDLPEASAGYGVDFNPTVDRVRVVTGTGLNLRLNPVNGTAVDGNPNVAGVNPDGAISGAATSVSATAYTNSYTNATLTTQYTLSSVSNALLIQNPPNNGTQTRSITVTLNNAPLDFTEVNGFDIPTAVQAPSANAPASGVGYAALTVGSTSGLYSIDLTTGAATLVGTVATGAVSARGLAVWTPITAPAFRVLLPLIGKV